MRYRKFIPLMLIAFLCAIVTTLVSVSMVQAADLLQQAGATVTKTVGRTPGCAEESEITVNPGASVFYCISVQNTGNVDLVSITINDPALGITNQTVTFPAPLPPGGPVFPITRSIIPELGPVTALETTVNTASYEVTAENDTTDSGTASATVNVEEVNASAVVTKTVRSIQGCADSSEETVAAGVAVYYCLRVENTGNVAFESISVTDNVLGITNLVVTFQQPLPPGASIPLPSTVITGFGPVVINETTVNTVDYTLTATEGSTVDGTASATVTVVAPAPDANVRKTVGAIPGCADESELSIATGLNVYYCLVVENSGNVPFESLVFTDTTLSVTNRIIAFPQPLPPQGTISFTRSAVPEFGPVTTVTDTVNTIEYQLIGVEGSTTEGTASATVTTGPAEPSAVVTKTVGTTPGCSDTSEATVVVGTNAFYCLRVENTGNVPFASVAITDTNLAMANDVFTFSVPIPPGVAAPLSIATVPQFGPVLITEDTVNTLDYTLTGTEGSTTGGTATATVTTIPAAASAVVTKTVGTTPGCVTTSEITVIAGASVFYCLTVENTGNVSFASISITDPNVGLASEVITSPVPPGASIPLPSSVITEFGPVVINETTVNTLDYILTAVQGSTVDGTTSATVNVEAFDPAAVVTKTVGTTPVCATTTEITVDPGASVFYCLTVENTGNVPFESVSITDPNVGLSDEVFTFPAPLPPGASIPLPSVVVTGFGPVVINETTVNTLDYALAGTNGSTVDGSASATVNMTPISIELDKTVGTTANQCAATSTITVPAGTTVFYCFTVTNTGEFTLTLHNLEDSELGPIHSDLELELAPGESDSSTIESETITTSTTNTATWTAFVAQDGASANATDTATVNVEGSDEEEISLPIIRVGSQ